MTIDELYELGVEEIIVKDSLVNKLKEGKKLRIKMGFDPTRPDLHLGHAVGLRILKKLQDEGHTIIFIIGDYTTKIGDPSGKNSTRPVLTDAEIKENAKTYFEQVGKILDVSKAEIVYNSEWFEKMNFADVIKLATNFTVAQIIEREDFAKRIKEGHDIGLHETLYALMQAYDSIQVKADVEFGGTDQKFNLLAGRQLQKKMGEPLQDVVMVKLLVGLDGQKKMSKSLDNYIALTDSAKDMFGKIMSIPDSLIVDYFKLCTEVKKDAIELIEKELKDETRNPRDIKAELAKIIVEIYHNEEDAIEAEEEFNSIFRDKLKPSDMIEQVIEVGECRVDDLIMKCEMASSKSEAMRLIEQGGVKIEDEKIVDPRQMIEIKDGMIVQVGKRKFIKVRMSK